MDDLRASGVRAAAPDILGVLPGATGALAFVRNGRGIVGWGERHRFEAAGADSAARIQEWFAAIVAAAAFSGEASPIVFVSLGFGPEDTSIAIVPQVVWRTGPESAPAAGTAAHGVSENGSTGNGSAQRVIGAEVPVPERTAVGRPGTVRWSDQQQSALGYRDAVAAAVDEIRGGALGKVVLSHDLTAVTEFPVDERFLLAALAQSYPTCWAYAVDGLIGASPEMLIERHRDGDRSMVTSRVLAGTGWAEHADDAVIANLLSSSKNNAEHRYAVDSVASALQPFTTALTVPQTPEPLVLANLVHLATDVVGELLAPAPSALALAAALHPTAAVGGYPRQTALALIRRLEGRPRGRYAAPIGWMAADGDGEFALALRGAAIEGSTVRLTAGGGLVADSDPDAEVREAQIKMIPMRDALES